MYSGSQQHPPFLLKAHQPSVSVRQGASTLFSHVTDKLLNIKAGEGTATRAGPGLSWGLLISLGVL